MGKKRILCIDDDPGVLNSLRRLLERKGYDVITSENGEDALAAGPVDLVILDLMMPGMDGYEVLEKIRRVRPNSAPVVILSAKDQDHEIMRGYKNGAVYYIAKPFKNKYVTNIVNYLIGDLSEAEKEALETKL